MPAPPAAPATPVEVLRGLVLGDGAPMPDDLVVTQACRYLDAVEVAALGLAGFVARANAAVVGDGSFTHERRLHSFCDHAARVVGEPIDEETQLVLVGDYIEQVEDRGDPAGPGPFVAWLFAALGLEVPADFAVTPVSPLPSEAPASPAAPVAKPRRRGKKAAAAAEGPAPGQQSLPFDPGPAGEVAAAPAAAAAKEKTKKLADLSGRKIKYREGNGWVIGRVDAGCGGGATLSFTAEDGTRREAVRRDLCKVIAARRPKAADADGADGADDADADAAPAAPPPEIVLAVPTKAAKKWGKLLRAAGHVAAAAPGAVLAFYEAEVDGQVVCAEVTNGTPGANGAYLDIYVAEGGHAVMAHRPVQDLEGRYAITVAGSPRTLVIAAGAPS